MWTPLNGPLSGLTPPSEKIRVHLTLFWVSVFFGGFYVVAKLTLRDMPPGFLVFARVSGAALFLQALARMRGAGRLPEKTSDRWRLALYALLGVVLNQLLFMFGLERSSATVSSILITTIPVFTAAFALMLRLESLSLRRLAGIALAMGGVLILLSPGFGGGPRAGDSAALEGNLMIAANCLSYALYLVLSRSMTERMDSLSMIAWIFSFGCLGVLPFGLHDALRMDFAALPMRAWLGVAYAVVFPTMLAYWMNVWALRRAGATMVALYVCVQPLVAAALAAAFLGESLGPRDLVAALLVFTGVWFASVSGKARGA